MADSPFILDVGAGTFETEVIERSRQVPVLVDFWAGWCGPCKALGPILEKITQEMNGEIVLAKVDTDAEQELATRYGVRGIPDVKLFKDGEMVDGFVGALPESAVRDFVRKHCPSEADRYVIEAREKLETGDSDGARISLDAALALDAEQAGAHLELARIALAEGDTESVERHLQSIPMRAEEAIEAERLREALAFVSACSEAGGEAASREAMETAPEDLDARFAHGACLAVAARYEEALETWLESVAKKPGHADAAARKAMVTVFGILGTQHELTRAFRRRLALYL